MLRDEAGLLSATDKQTRRRMHVTDSNQAYHEHHTAYLLSAVFWNMQLEVWCASMTELDPLAQHVIISSSLSPCTRC